ncbi:MAG: aspartate aminotransferase family protein [Deltaproteobacteria bacterium]|nr:aspartate aminotransferase family protein [Deltaproteobacteria bacterium]
MENIWSKSTARKLDRKAANLIALPTKEAPQSSNEELLASDSEYVLRPWTGAGEPLPIVEGHGIYVKDADGKLYMDFTSGYFVNQAGHSHPKVIAAAIDQLQKVSQVSGRHASEPSIGLAKKLAEIAPGSLKKTLFTTGGCESTEFAIKMVRQASGLPGIACVDNAFHGLSVTALSACANESYRKSASAPLDPTFVRAPTPYCYRCPHATNCETQCVDQFERVLDEAPEVGAILAEPIQAVGGIIPPEKWWRRVDAMRRRRGLLLLLDEIQTGLGRTGSMFAAEHYGLEPDVMALAKGLSGGVGSLGGVMASPEIAAKFFGATSPTSAGNAVSCAAGRALIDVIIEEKLCENAAAMGRYMTGAVAERNLPWVGDIRFKGLLGGVELVENRDTKKPLDKRLIMQIKADLLERGVIVTVSGPLGNVIRIQPPLSVTSGQIDTLVTHLDAALRAACQKDNRCVDVQATCS